MGRCFHITLLAALFTIISAEYSDDFSRNVMFPLAVATYDRNPNVCIKSGTGDGQLRRQIELPCDVLNETCSGYSAFSNSKNAIILGFRGSEGTYEIDMEALDILFGKQLWNGRMKDDYLTLRQQYPNYEAWCTGDSLGAAMAGLAAGYLEQTGLADGNKIKLITYGEPRTGDKNYAALINNLIPYSYRVVHASDWVPHLPLMLENYEHHSTEIWYSKNMAISDPYTVCQGNEDKRPVLQFQNLFG